MLVTLLTGARNWAAVTQLLLQKM